MIELTDSLKTLFQETAKQLRGSERRRYIAQTAKELGKGGQRQAQREIVISSAKASER